MKITQNCIDISKNESASLMLNKLFEYPIEKGRKSAKLANKNLEDFCKVANTNKKFGNFFKYPNSKTFIGKTSSRFMINRNNSLISNGSLELDRFGNYPVIPGSALKGVSSYAAWAEWLECDDEEGKIKIAQEIIEVFGYPTGNKDFDDLYKFKDCAGKIIFFDAKVVDKDWKLEIDIITPHKDDITNPIPIKFPVVAEGAKFKFIIAKRNHTVEDKILEKALAFLKLAIKEYGLGAKTSVGYGYFEEVI